MVKGFYPATVSEALVIRREYPDSLLVSGGSDVMVVKKTAPGVLFLNQIQEIKEVVRTEEVLRIGAGSTYAELLAKEEVPEVLKQAMRKIASPAIRNVGTVAGNICNASPAGDTLPVLYAMDAVVVKACLGDNGVVKESRVPIQEFILGIRKIALQPQEIVTAIEIPVSSFEGMTKNYYQKVGAREAEAISKLSFVGLYRVENQIITDVRIAFGSVGITVVRVPELEQKITGLHIDELKANKAAILADYDAILHPIDDQRSTAVYRKKVCMNLLDDFLFDRKLRQISEC